MSLKKQTGTKIHVPVMPKEVLSLLNIVSDGIYIDGTIGLGGHASIIQQRLSNQGHLIGVDRDEEAIKICTNNLSSSTTPISLFNNSYHNLESVLDDLGIIQVSGILLDLGLSSMQLDSMARGFSYKSNSNLDMRFDISQKTEGYGENVFSELLGIDISRDAFTSDDRGVQMAPYFSGSSNQRGVSSSGAINSQENTALNRVNGGPAAQYYFNKREREGDRPVPYGNVHGMQDTGPAMEQDRYISGMYRTDERPFEQERVPHIDEASDINRDVDLIYAQRNSVDNTRTLSNQKVSFGGKVLPGKGVDERGKIGQVFKHNPDKDYENTADKWLVTNGATVAKTLRPEQILPETNRQHLNRQEMGPIFSSGEYGYKPGEKRPNVKESEFDFHFTLLTFPPKLYF